MTGEMYQAILKENLIQSAKKLNFRKNMVFQQDNDPKHTAHVIKVWLNKKGIECLTWPPLPIEHLWDELERRMKNRHPKNKNELP